MYFIFCETTTKTTTGCTIKKDVFTISNVFGLHDSFHHTSHPGKGFNCSTSRALLPLTGLGPLHLPLPLPLPLPQGLAAYCFSWVLRRSRMAFKRAVRSLSSPRLVEGVALLTGILLVDALPSFDGCAGAGFSSWRSDLWFWGRRPAFYHAFQPFFHGTRHQIAFFLFFLSRRTPRCFRTNTPRKLTYAFG